MVTGAYTPRNPKASALYQCVQAHFGEFEAAYPTRYQEQYGFYRPVIGRVVVRASAGMSGLALRGTIVRTDLPRMPLPPRPTTSSAR